MENNTMLWLIFSMTVIFVVPYVAGQSLDNCPSDMRVGAPFPDQGARVRWVEPIPSDGNWDILLRSHTPGDMLEVGISHVTYIFEKSNSPGNRLTCAFRVEVVREDNEPPEIQGCPNDTTHFYEAGPSNVPAYWTEPQATDNSGTAVLTQRSIVAGEPVYIVERRNHRITYTFQDPSENEAFCTFQVRFIPVDTTPPSISHCPYTNIVDVPLDSDGTVVSWDPPQVDDNYGGFTLQIQPEITNNFFPLGVSRLNYTYTDQDGNFDTCTVNVMVNRRDITPPEVTFCPEEFVYGTRPGQEYVYVDWYTPEAEDDSEVVYLDQRSHRPGAYRVDEFPLQVTYTFNDPAWNEALCSFTVKAVPDDEPPTIFGCPSEDVVVSVPEGSNVANVTWGEPQARDDTTIEQVILSHYPGDEFGIGNTTVEYVFEDTAGNVAVCSFVVMVTYGNAVSGGESSSIAIVIIICVTLVVIAVALLIAFVTCRRRRRSTPLLDPNLPIPPGLTNESYSSLTNVPRRPLPSIREPPAGAPSPNPAKSETPADEGYIQPILSQ